MIYLIGGVPRAGKSILAQQLAANLKIGWISTDLLVDLLRAKQVVGPKTEWNAEPQAIAAAADWFFPCLERFVWGVSSMADQYVIEGVDFLPAQAVQLAAQYPIRLVFLGCSQMTPARFDQFPGHSKGYAGLPEAMRRRMAHDIPLWSSFIQQEAARFGCPYIDMSVDFHNRLQDATTLLTAAESG
jgi:hypothetical protein